MTIQEFLNKILLPLRLQVQKMPRGSKVYGINWVEDANRLLAHQPPRIIVDVGANCGQTTRRLTRAFPDADVLAIEPTPETFKRLTKRMAEYPKVRPIQMAVGDKDGTAPFIVRDHHESNSFLEISPGATLEKDRLGTVDVKVQTLPVFAQEQKLERIDILKTNAEGFDFRILAAAKPFLEKQGVRLIFTEVMFTSVFEGQAPLQDFLNLLLPLGYRFVGLYETAIDRDGGLLHANALFISSKV